MSVYIESKFLITHGIDFKMSRFSQTPPEIPRMAPEDYQPMAFQSECSCEESAFRKHSSKKSITSVAIKTAAFFCLILFAIIGVITVVKSLASARHDEIANTSIENQLKVIPHFIAPGEDHPGPGKQRPCSCVGANTTQQAIEMGCSFDILASAWLQPYCIDQMLTREFERSGPGPHGAWTHHVDGDIEKTLSLKEVSELLDTDGHYYSSFEWHINHCVFYWRKQWRASRLGHQVEPLYNTEEHIVHCGNLFLRRNPLDTLSTYNSIYRNVDDTPVLPDLNQILVP